MALKTARETVGERLREARATRGLDLGRAAEETHLQHSVLEALERDAPPEELHGALYARIFLREYARYLGLDPRKLVSEYRGAHPAPDRPLIGGPPPLERRSQRWLTPVLITLSAGALTVMAVLQAGRSPERDRVAVPRMAGPAPASPAASPASEPVEESVDGLEMEIRVIGAHSWLRVLRSGDVVFEGTLGPGSVRAFRAPRALDLVVGNAGATRVTANGIRLPELGGVGDVFLGRVVLRAGEAELVPAG